jgi:hypothetical protein
MNIHKKVKKFWSGSANFKVSEIFNSVSAAYKQAIPSNAAVYEVDNDTVSLEFARIKEVENNADALPTSGSKDPGKGKGEKKLEHKDNKAVKK